jgi:xylan 1,4-beta-xylosidase
MRVTSCLKGSAAFSLVLTLLCAALTGAAQTAGRSWAADNGNGTYSNPLFYDEFSDPDMIRLEGGRSIYGQGIWAPSFRYHNGTDYIFANVNRFGLQVFRASDPRGPWKHNRIEKGLHDISVLFDDDGKIYAVYGASTIRIVELNQDLTAFVPETDRVLIEKGQGMGEGSHIYKIRGKYYIVSAIPGAHVPMKCARADKLTGPWEVTIISEEESLGIGQGYRLKDSRPRRPGARPQGRLLLCMETRRQKVVEDN